MVLTGIIDSQEKPMWFRRRRNESTEEAVKALEDAETHLTRIRTRGCEVSKVASALRDIRERNHFAEQMEEIILRNKGKANGT